jgi:hypothetical protein
LAQVPDFQVPAEEYKRQQDEEARQYIRQEEQHKNQLKINVIELR